MNPTEKFITDRIENNLTFNCFDTNRQYSLHTLVEWMDDFAHEELLKYVYDETRINALAEIYKRSVEDAAMVATICDDVIDRSGRLLGEVRNVVRTKIETKI